jgi:mono/diheme cytochrome c family protein
MKRSLNITTLLCTAALASASAAELGSKLEPMFDQHCYDCHDADAKKGGLDLAALKWKPDDVENLQQWTKVFDKVERGEMPPKKKERPPAAVSSTFLKTLHDELHTFSRHKQESEGRVVYRRLNRTEYVNTINDLLGIDTPLRDMLPEDGTAGGFDNIGAALNLSAVHLERYLQAADLALKEATITTPKPETKKIRTDYNETWHDWNAPGFQNSQWTHSPEGLLAIRWNGGNGPHGELGAWSPPVPDARYRFRIRARAMIDKEGPNANANDKKRPDRHIVLKVALADWPRTGLTFGNTYFEMSPTEFREFEYGAHVPQGKTLWLSPYRAVPETPEERAMVSGICAVVEWVEIEGPLHEQWPPRGHQLLYGDLPLQPANPKAPTKDLHVVSSQPEADARRLLSAFLPRVFRRPVSEEEVNERLELVKEQMQKGRRFDEALRAAYKMALCSPKFLFLQEKVGVLDDHALASRLSYGLWSTAPDDELTNLATQKKLHEPATLRAQTERMLASPKAMHFTQNFLGSWLNLRDIEFTQPDTKLYPEFEQYLQQSMVGETERFFEEMLTRNLSVRNIMHSDFAMLNERLAEHYGIAGVKGEEIRKVSLAPGSRRGGFITQGAVLKVSANGTSTSPVVRGAYVLDRILGTPPDPPPKNVPAIEPDIRGATTIREQLDKHRNQQACAACHAKLDPPGFALENFDVTGRWRTSYRAIPDSAKDKVVNVPGTDVRFYTQGRPVDPSFTMADGRPFKDVDEFKQLILAQPGQLARCVTEKLITHFTGAQMQFADREVVEAIVQRAASNDYGLRTLVHEVIQSRVFTHK